MWSQVAKAWLLVDLTKYTRMVAFALKLHIYCFPHGHYFALQHIPNMSAAPILEDILVTLTLLTYPTLGNNFAATGIVYQLQNYRCFSLVVPWISKIINY